MLRIIKQNSFKRWWWRWLSNLWHIFQIINLWHFLTCQKMSDFHSHTCGSCIGIGIHNKLIGHSVLLLYHSWNRKKLFTEIPSLTFYGTMVHAHAIIVKTFNLGGGTGGYGLKGQVWNVSKWNFRAHAK